MFFLQRTLLRKSKDKSEWGKIFANHMSDKGLVSQTDKELLKANNKELNLKNSSKWTFFFKESLQMINKHFKTCSASLVIREMEIPTIMRYHFTPSRMAILKATNNNIC